MGAHNLAFSIHLSNTKLSMSLSHADTFTRQTWTPTYTCTIALQHIWIIKIKIQANTLIFYVGENIIIYTIIHVTSVPIWPKFEVVQDLMPVLLPASLTKIRLKMKASAWRHRFHHYKSMGAFCCYGNHSFGGICSLFPIPLMIHVKNFIKIGQLILEIL